jgi:hypothetical protein
MLNTNSEKFGTQCVKAKSKVEAGEKFMNA